MRPAMAAAGTRSGRQAMRLLRQLEGLVGRRILGRLRLRDEQHRAPAIGDGLVDAALPASDGQRVERALPVAGPALQVEQRLDRPVELGIELAARARRTGAPPPARRSRWASRNRPRRPSCSVSGEASMASKMRRLVARSPASCAVCARSRWVSGSCGRALRAWPA